MRPPRKAQPSGHHQSKPANPPTPCGPASHVVAVDRWLRIPVSRGADRRHVATPAVFGFAILFRYYSWTVGALQSARWHERSRKRRSTGCRRPSPLCGSGGEQVCALPSCGGGKCSQSGRRFFFRGHDVSVWKHVTRPVRMDACVRACVRGHVHDAGVACCTARQCAGSDSFWCSPDHTAVPRTICPIRAPGHAKHLTRQNAAQTTALLLC